MRTLLDLLLEARRLGRREAIRFHNGFRTWKYSYRDLYGRAGALARRLEEEGLGKGDRLILWGENRPEWVVVFWAALARGIELVPVDYRSSRRLVERIQREVEAKLLVYGSAVEAKGLDLPKIALDAVGRLEPLEGFEPGEADPGDVVEIVYTSGTTGEPKGVVHRHRNICANLRMFEREINRYKPLARPFQPVRILDLLPLSHLFGQSLGIVFPVLLETSVVFLTELHPGLVMETIRRERASVLVAVPRLLSGLRRELERRFELAPEPETRGGLLGFLLRWWTYRRVHKAFGWKFWALVVGGARLSPEEEDFWWRLGFAVIQGYGLTETSPIVTANHPLHPQRGSIGYVVEGQEVRLAPDGEILVRGESVVTEYFRAPADSDTRFVDGWLHTGDIAEKDAEGRLYYRGRKKDVIVTSDGLNVYPQDVEAVLNRHPDVTDSVVVGLGSDHDEAVHAVILPARSDIDTERIVREANRALEPHQRIRSWSIWPEADFPRTASTFKIQRGAVRRRLLDAQARKPSAPGTSAGGLLSAVAGLAGKAPSEVHETTRLSEDLGLSSLDRVELLSALENDYSIEMDEARFAELETVGDIKTYIEKEGSRTAGSPAKSQALAPVRMPRWPRVFPVPVVRHTVLGLGVGFLWYRYIDFSVEGLNHLDELAPPVIFAANHASHLDTLAILLGLPFRWRRRVRPAMQQEHFRATFEPAGFPLRERLWRGLQYVLACGLVNAYPLPQKMAGVRRALKFTGELVDKGDCPLIYPEGERSPDGRIQRFKPGIGLMAAKLGVPVVPIYLKGMYAVYSVHDSWPRPGRVAMHLGPPLRPRQDEDADVIARRVEEAIRALSREEREPQR